MKNVLLTVCLLLCARFVFAQTFTLSSTDLGGQFTNDFIAANFGCTGSNRSPELHWTNPPAGTKSFAITMYDADAPTGSGFWHWVVVDIPSTVLQLKSGAGTAQEKLMPAGSLQSMNDTGAPGYQGPCPPEGDAPHRYIITVYALNKAKLGSDIRSTAALTGFMLHNATIAKASLMVYCKR